MTQCRPRLRLRPHLRGARPPRSRAAPRRRRQRAGRSADHRARSGARRLAPLLDPAVDIATLATPITRARGKRRSQCRQGGREARSAPRRLRALYFTRAARALGRGRPSASHRPLRLSRAWRSRASSGCRPRRWRSASGWSSCARWKRACGSTSRSSTSRRSASTRRKILERARERCSRRGRGHEHEQTCRSPIRASRAPIRTSPASRISPTCQPLPCATFEDAFAALQDGAADLGMIPIENSIAGRVADIHNLLPASGLHIIGETFLPIHFQLARPARRADRGPAQRPQPCPCARPVPQDHPQASVSSRSSPATRRARRARSRNGATRAAPRSRPGSPARSTA